MKIIPTVALLAAVTALAACSKEPPCTAEVLAKKGQDLAAAVQAAIAKDPAKATVFATKMQEIAAKYQGSSEAEACKAYDDLIASVKE